MAGAAALDALIVDAPPAAAMPLAAPAVDAAALPPRCGTGPLAAPEVANSELWLKMSLGCIACGGVHKPRVNGISSTGPSWQAGGRGAAQASAPRPRVPQSPFVAGDHVGGFVWVAAEARSYTRRCARSRTSAMAASAQRGRQWAKQTRVLVSKLVSELKSNK